MLKYTYNGVFMMKSKDKLTIIANMINQQNKKSEKFIKQYIKFTNFKK